MSLETIKRAAAESPFLLKEPYRSRVVSGLAHPLTGHCYVASEAAYHSGLRDRGFVPHFVKHEGSPHWFLKGPDGQVVDLTAEQFATPVSYDNGKGKGFLTKQPSRRAQVLLEIARRVA